MESVARISETTAVPDLLPAILQAGLVFAGISAWESAIQKAISYSFPKQHETAIAEIIYATIVTVIVIILIITIRKSIVYYHDVAPKIQSAFRADVPVIQTALITDFNK